MIIDKIDIKYLSKDFDEFWIYPEGDIAELIMLNSVINVFHEHHPNIKINLVKRSDSIMIFENNSSINKIGFPKDDDLILKTDYWNKDFFENSITPFDCLYRLFGFIKMPEEKVILNNIFNNNSFLFNEIPWKKRNILIAPFSNRIINCSHPLHWHFLVNGINKNNLLLLQSGHIDNIHIKGAYSILGESSFDKLLKIVQKVDLIVTHDNFFIQLAKFFEKKCIVITGPKNKRTHVFNDQIVFKSTIDMTIPECSKCVTKYTEDEIYDCPLGQEKKCMNNLNFKNILNCINSKY